MVFRQPASLAHASRFCQGTDGFSLIPGSELVYSDTYFLGVWLDPHMV